MKAALADVEAEAETEDEDGEPLLAAGDADWADGRVVVRVLRGMLAIPGSSPNRHAQNMQRLCAEEAWNGLA